MLLLLQLAVVVCVVQANDLRFLSVPQSVKLPSPGTTQALDSANLAHLNANLLGLSTQTPKGFAVETDLFSRPRALAIIQISGIELPTDGDKYAVTQDANADETTIDEGLAMTFGADREAVTISGDGITGTGLAQQSAQQKVDEGVIKSKLPALRAELKNIYALADAIKMSGTKFNKESVDIFRITIQGLAGLDLTADEKSMATSDVTAALDYLARAFSTVYGDQVVLELISLSTSASTVPNFENGVPHVIKKRAADDDMDNDPIVKARKQYNVSVMVSSDYPAIFAIFAGLVIALALAVLYTTVGMMTMDPGKDSIIYRMTTTRMKKD